MGKSITTSSSTSSTKSQSHSASASQSEKRSESTSSKYLDEKLRDEILSGLIGQMTDEEIAAYAEGLLRPQLNAALEASQHEYETAKLAREQEIENLAVSLASAIAAQQGAYSQAMADTQNAALARGMGRSSYVMENLAGHGSALASSVRSLTEENQRLRSQIQQRDVLLFYPYQSMQPFLDLLKESVADPQVLSIKITIYRLARNSAIAKYLCAAADRFAVP